MTKICDLLSIGTLIDPPIKPLVILLYDGGGSKPGPLHWLRYAGNSFTLEKKAKSGRVFKLMSRTDFISWVNKAFR